MTSTSKPSYIHFQKKVVKYIVVKLDYEDFRQYHMKEGENEREDDFNKRCRQVWKKLCDKAKKGCIELEDEEIDEDDNDDVDDEIEEAVEEAVEEVDKEEAIAFDDYLARSKA